MRTPRHRAREFALQGVYQALLNPDYSALDIIRNIEETEPFVKALEGKRSRVDPVFFTTLAKGALAGKEHYEELITPFLERGLNEVNLIERAILILAAFELESDLVTPAAVIINEAIELTKVYAQEDSYRFINGVVDKMAASLRGERER